jgi:hypothetical protein
VVNIKSSIAEANNWKIQCKNTHVAKILKITMYNTQHKRDVTAWEFRSSANIQVNIKVFAYFS